MEYLLQLGARILIKNKIDKMKTINYTLAVLATLLVGSMYGQPNIQNFDPNTINTTVNDTAEIGMGWITWGAWIVSALGFAYVIYMYVSDSPSKKTGLVTLGVIVAIASIFTVIFQ